VRVSAILLAAGASTRMGRQKALLPWHGATLLEYQLEQLASSVEQIIVVTGCEPERVTTIAAAAGATVVHNDAWRTGKASSIVTGLRAVAPDADAILLLAVDQPRAADVHATLLAEHARAHASITVPVSDGHRGHPIIFDRSLLPELLAISEGTQGVREVLRRRADDIVEVEFPPSAGVRLDLNEPRDVPDWETETPA
jgi:CTP:molybdopterin cytidylyltransferase MocA